MIPDRTLDAVTKGPDGFSETPGGGVMASGHDATALFAMIATRSALRFEVETGMKMSRVSALASANRILGTNYKRKQKALDHLDAVLEIAKGEGL